MMAAVKLARQLSDACGFHVSAAALEAILLRTRATWLHTSVRGEHKIASGSFGAIYDAPDIDSMRLGDAPAIIKVGWLANQCLTVTISNTAGMPFDVHHCPCW
jgi:hypothetical protein